MRIDVKANIEQKIKLFFFYTSLVSRYAEGTDNKLKEDYQLLLKWIISDQVPSIVSDGILWNTSKYITITKKSAFGKAVLCLINAQKPRDFYENKMVGIGENVETSQIHHIFPEAQYKGMAGESINSIFNYTFLTGEANNFINNKETGKYISEILQIRGISEETFKDMLSKHIIDEECYKYICSENYEQFLEKRADCIRKKFAGMGIRIQNVSKEQIDEAVDDEDLTSDTE